MPKNTHFLVECISDINILIKKPLQQTLRIKFTTFDVSHNYLVFGATSGGIYVFNRNKLDFLKLVPSKEGAIQKLLICPEEKYVLIATSKGIVLLIENCFTELPIKYQIFSEHENNTITDIIWHYNEIYCGDIKGKVSVISINSLLSKAIFQTPTAILMHLDSSISQLDACGKFLLVSTKSKTFLCDTEIEQYKQIGKKLRDGDFGACFFAEDLTHCLTNRVEKEKNRFRFVKNDDSSSSSSSTHTSQASTNPNARIYCTRPGFRMWEANIDGSVLCTYQFKSALQENVTETICLDTDINSRLKTRKLALNLPNFDNFGRLHRILHGNFLITYSKNNLVIFDRQGIRVLFVYEMRDIHECKVIHNYLYIWNKKDIRVVAVMDFEFLLLKVLSTRQYLLCIELCLKYNENIYKLLEKDTNTNEALRSLLVLKDKCKPEEVKCLEAIFNDIECRIAKDDCCTKVKEAGSGLGSKIPQIVVVENGHRVFTEPMNEPSCSTVQTVQPIKVIRKSLNLVHPTSGPSVPKVLEPMQDPNYINNILYKQYQVNQLYDNIETAQLYEVLSSKPNLDDIVDLFDKFVEYVAQNDLEQDNNNVRNWCYIQYLKYMNNKRDCVQSLHYDSIALKAIKEALVCNGKTKTDGTLCVCGFPLPLIEQSTDEYFSLAKDIYMKLSTKDREQLVLQFPILWKVKVDEVDALMKLPLIIQLGDVQLLKDKSENFTNDNWSDCTLLLAKLKRGICLNCDNKIMKCGTILWKDFALIMLKRVGGLNTTKVLKKHAKYIPNTELGYEFYQSCLFSAVSKENGKSCDFMTNVLTNARLEHQFEDGLRAYLNQKHLGKSIDARGVDRIDTKCAVCHLLINNAILDISTRLSCGHLFHKLCLESVSGICSACMQLPN